MAYNSESSDTHYYRNVDELGTFSEVSKLTERNVSAVRSQSVKETQFGPIGSEDDTVYAGMDDIYSYAVTSRSRVILPDAPTRPSAATRKGDEMIEMTRLSANTSDVPDGKHEDERVYQSLQRNTTDDNGLVCNIKTIMKYVALVLLMSFIAAAFFMIGSSLESNQTVVKELIVDTTVSKESSLQSTPDARITNTSGRGALITDSRDSDDFTSQSTLHAEITVTTVQMTPEVHICSQYACITDGWLVWLRRVDNSISFNRTWDEYEQGFGNYEENFWLGLETLHDLTGGRKGRIIRVELESWTGERKWAEYTKFKVSDNVDNYRLTVGGYNEYSTAPNMMRRNNNQTFTTIDRDNDGTNINCAKDQAAGGGWWYGGWYADCSFITPTALIGVDGDSKYPYMYWRKAFDGDMYQALTSLTMMIRPNDED